MAHWGYWPVYPQILHVVMICCPIYTCIWLGGVPCTYRACTISHLLWNPLLPPGSVCLLGDLSHPSTPSHARAGSCPEHTSSPTLHPHGWRAISTQVSSGGDGPGQGARSIGSAPMPALVLRAPLPGPVCFRLGAAWSARSYTASLSPLFSVRSSADHRPSSLAGSCLWRLS